MATNLFVGNLSFQTTTADLTELFSQAGTVTSVNIITDRDTGRSRGFGFVEMASAQEAQAAIEQFNGYEANGRALTVNEARPRESHSGRDRSLDDDDRSRDRRRGGGGRERRW